MEDKNTTVVKEKWYKRYFGRFVTVRGITEMGLLVALAILFDQPFFKISFGKGASLSLTMVPLFIIALRFPIVDSFLGIGVVYGFTTFLLDNPESFASYPFDYLLGYGSIAIASFFRFYIFNRKKKLHLRYLVLILSVLLGVSLRIFWSTLSGFLLYEETLLGSFLYNSPAMASSAVLVIVVLILLYSTLDRFKPLIYPFPRDKDKNDKDSSL